MIRRSLKWIMPGLLLIVFLLPFHAEAEPGKSATYLMNDKISLLEWGLYRLEESLKAISFEHLDLVHDKFLSVTYDWDKNRIDLEAIIHPSYSSFSQSGPKEICRSTLFMLKTMYGYGWVNKEHVEYYGIGQFFKHKGYARKDVPETLMDDIETMTKITVKIFANKTDKPVFSEQCSCTSRLMEDDIYFLDKESKSKP